MLRYVIKEYLVHYHAERNHQGIDSKIITPKFADAIATPTAPRSTLGGLLNYYGLRAA